MCFSETASFAVAAACAFAGALAVFKSPSLNHLPLAAVPLVFAVQQASEGLVWRTLDQVVGLPAPGWPATLFVFIATVVWPVFVPLSVLLAQEDGHRKRIIAALTATGCLVSLVFVVRLVNADVTASVAGASIQYTSQIKPGVSLPLWLLSEAQGGTDWILVPYAVATIGALACSALPALRLFAGLVAAVLVVLLAADQDTLVSVWCFFAASGSLLLIPAILSASSRFRKEPAESAPGSRRLPADSRGP
ncbi:DUF6629 family protein [Hyphomonas sp.]|jgi:hypothetical protein|uniref:DUF6629 family protein n=1 Tax=Hyphomonas sp. TaxID=87 RepID=UPI0037C14B64